MRVLVVEDDIRMAAAIRRALRTVNVIGDVASTSKAACAMLADTAYDVIVLDVMLPDTDGFTTCRQLRSAGEWTPIIMVTARGAVDDRIRGLDAGADDYLPKPFAFGELLARLRALARRDPAERPVIIAVGPLRLDPAAARVWRGDREIRLSTREFALFEAFMRSPGQVLGHGQLLGCGLGHRARLPIQRDRGVHPLSQGEDRPAVRRTVAGDRTRPRLPAATRRRKMSRRPITVCPRWLTRSGSLR